MVEWKGEEEVRRDEMLTRTLAQWIFQRVKTPKPASNIPASIFVSLSAAEFSQPASVLPIAATGSWGGIEMSAAAAWHARRYETKPIVDGEREGERKLLRNDFILSFYIPISFLIVRISSGIRENAATLGFINVTSVERAMIIDANFVKNFQTIATTIV